METLILIGLASAAFCFALLQTNAPEEYLKRIFKERSIFNPTGPEEFLSLPMRLKAKYPNNFWVSLVTCGTCLSVWVATLTCFFLGVLSIIKIGTAVTLTWSAYYLLIILKEKAEQ